MSRHDSEQNGRCGFPCQVIGLSQRGQCARLVLAASRSFTAPSYRPASGLSTSPAPAV